MRNACERIKCAVNRYTARVFKHALPTIAVIVCAAVCLSSCASSPTAQTRIEQTAQTSDASAAQTSNADSLLQTAPQTHDPLTIPEDLTPVDYDFSSASQTILYAQVYDMIYNPDTYTGKTVRMTGVYDEFTDEESGLVHRVCTIQDASACCTQGIEFELPGEAAEYPQRGSQILVSGTFDTYMQDLYLYCVLRSAQVEAESP